MKGEELKGWILNPQKNKNTDMGVHGIGNSWFVVWDPHLN